MSKWYEKPIIGMVIIKKKYLYEPEKTFDDMVERISECFGRDMREKIKAALSSAAFFPLLHSVDSDPLTRIMPK